VKDEAWWMQENLGHSTIIRKTDDGVEAISDDAVVLPAAVIQAAQQFRGSWTLEGALMGDVFVVFDLLKYNFMDFKNNPYWLRFNGLKVLLKPEDQRLRIAETAMQATAKTILLERLRDGGNPSVIFKKSNAGRVYNPSAPNSLAYCFRNPEPSGRPGT
jgi:hypothetical protein